MRANIYTVHIGEEEAQRRTVVVVVAETAQDAHEAALRAAGHVETEGDTEVGLLGSYDPGITGARLSQDAVIAIQRIDQR